MIYFLYFKRIASQDFVYSRYGSRLPAVKSVDLSYDTALNYEKHYVLAALEWVSQPARTPSQCGNLPVRCINGPLTGNWGHAHIFACNRLLRPAVNMATIHTHETIENGSDVRQQ